MDKTAVTGETAVAGEMISEVQKAFCYQTDDMHTEQWRGKWGGGGVKCNLFQFHYAEHYYHIAVYIGDSEAFNLAIWDIAFLI
jgi:hypothetical protein